MDINQTKICIMPWIHLNVETNGDMHLCCQSDASHGAMGNTFESPIIDIWQGTKYKEIRQQMLDGVEPKHCQGCYNSERMGATSKRIRENNHWKKYWDLTSTVNAPNSQPYVDVRFSNICNLKCRSCNPQSSHVIGAEYKALGWATPKQILLESYSTELDRTLAENASHIDQVYFCGGEPLIMEGHYRLLQLLIDNQNFDAELRYSSNLNELSFKSYNVLDYWIKFNNVSVHASLDGIGNKIEYIRHGSKWSNILRNLDTLKSNGIGIKIAPTVSVFNILDIAEICKFYVDQGYVNIDDFGINVLDAPYYYSVQTLHPELKLVAKYRILGFIEEHPSMNEETKSKFNYLINYMMAKDSWLASKLEFIKVTEQLDKHRGEQFLNTFPELEKHIL